MKDNDWIERSPGRIDVSYGQWVALVAELARLEAEVGTLRGENTKLKEACRIFRVAYANRDGLGLLQAALEIDKVFDVFLPPTPPSGEEDNA